MFWNKPKPPEDVPIKDEIRGIKARITRMETDILDIMQSQQAIRDKIMRKIRLKVEETDNDSDTWAGIPKAKDINIRGL